MTALPDGWTTRRPTLDDLPELLALARASDIAAMGESDFTAEEIRETLTTPGTDLARDCWLTLDPAGAITGWGFLSNLDRGDHDRLEVFVLPGRGEPAMRPLLEVLQARALERAAEFGQPAYAVQAAAIPAEKAWIDILAEDGFTFFKQHARMTMSLDGVPATPPEPPAGVTLRTVRPDDVAEMRRFHATVLEAFRDTTHQPRGYEAWLERLAGEAHVSYDEWFVALVDGEWAGALESSDFGAANGIGWVRLLGVLPAYRRRGVGEALLRRAFATYAGKGRTEVGLGVDMANPTRAARLYLSVGMTPKFEANVYRKQLLTA
ncbi:GNAT family N-acetyltransferase [Actinoplanes sp. NPDC051494]|uniref:GNAT family N-acetyltransferase n=1 Tax=Actinoplanes sp. NPDC051494 TaxID=3363907 RepID=UPI00378EB342